MTDTIHVELYDGARPDLRPLFELAEDSAAELDAYLDTGRVLVAVADGEIIGHPQLTGTGDPRQAEVKNMAVREAKCRNKVVAAHARSSGSVKQCVRHGIQNMHSADVMRFLGYAVKASGVVSGKFAGEVKTELKCREEGTRFLARAKVCAICTNPNGDVTQGT